MLVYSDSLVLFEEVADESVSQQALVAESCLVIS